MTWHVRIQCDVIKGHWLEDVREWVWRERFYLVASRGNESYIHFYGFSDDYDTAKQTLDRIAADPAFTPEEKPGVWLPIRDVKEDRPPPWRRLKNWWIDYQR